ncbi:uncharacterized protein BX664DRAFT_281536 [Halteromyces radiatus]|uniref:uncharacterized protein n=1 Tax=Halteromyces radiatus TaxID=101107 RepID=UPI00221F3653|nr:uncharacterized protein BX664DRAFT_281536 [Halteromyces radiatus]KAI8085995.1 hypothetical protein BX664DRAFT_281536 [Halteromyces radiatus]
MDEPASCIGCDLPIEDGSIIAFGESLFHLKCFVCTKCTKPVDCNANLLLLTDGRPVCEQCSYTCTVCKKVIHDEAVMTGDEVYHADCFRCTSCHNTIADLVFTQTSKGIYCTPCYDKRRAEKHRRREKRQQQRLQNENTNPIQEPIRTRGSSLDTIKPRASQSEKITSSKRISRLDFSSSDYPALNLSFFENDSVDLLNLTSSLGANLLLDSKFNPSPPGSPFIPPNGNTLITPNPSNSVPADTLSDPWPSSSSSINRASDMLRSSLSFLDFPAPPERSNSLDDSKKSHQQLEDELKQAKRKLFDMEKNFNMIKDASQRALDEFSNAKEEFGKEMILRQQHETTIEQLRRQMTLLHQMHVRRGDFLPLNQSEIENVAQLRVELERCCNDLRIFRDRMAKDIDNFVQQKQAGLVSDPTSHLQEQQRSILSELRILKKERDALRTETSELSKLRDDVITEMVMLNTKNAELTEMNNDLSRRVIERERNTAAILSNTGEMQRQSSEHSPQDAVDIQKVASRDSYNGISAPKLFKIKKVNVFGKLNTNGTPARKDSVISPLNGSSPIHPSSGVYDMYNNASTLSFANKQVQDGSHAFMPTTYYKSTKCEGCHDRMKWGVSELRCQTCGMAAHTRCLGSLSARCQGTGLQRLSNDDGKQGQTMFGNDLTAQVTLEQGTIPIVVEACINAVEQRGMDYEGIYRKSGGAAQMRLIQQGFDRGDIDLSDDDTFNDICAVTSVLKTYFRELPDPLLTYDLYPKWMEVVASPDGPDKTETFCELLLQLPKTNLDTLTALIYHLNRIQQHHHENLMTIKNLAMVFGPTLLRDQDASRDLVDMGFKNATIEYLITHAYDLF